MDSEEILQFVWKNGLYRKENQETTCGRLLNIVSHGEHNKNSGPDFINARIVIDRIQWAGNVEIHQRASDWKKHGHHLDPSYNNVILHAVAENDTCTWNSEGRRIHTFVLEYPESLSVKYDRLQANIGWLPCRNLIGKVPPALLRRWYTHLHFERVSRKTSRISEILFNLERDWEETFYLVLASGFGLPINVIPFELLASGIPLKMAMELRDHPEKLEALLFGYAGFLHNGKAHGPYANGLIENYNNQKHWVRRRSLPVHLWKFHRLRPASFPTIRISQFSSLVHLRFPLMDSIIHAESLAETEQLLRVRASEYWNTHYLFGRCSPESEKFLGQQTIRILLVNAIVPFLMTFGRREGCQRAVNQGADILSELESESNQIIRKWIKFGIKPRNSFESQALIQLHNAYCKQKRCLDCQIGAGFLQSSFHEE